MLHLSHSYKLCGTLEDRPMQSANDSLFLTEVNHTLPQAAQRTSRKVHPSKVLSVCFKTKHYELLKRVAIALLRK